MTERNFAINQEFDDEDSDVEALAPPPIPARQPEVRAGFTLKDQIFGSQQDFSLTTFTGPVTFDSVTFVGGANFDGCVFQGKVRFKNVTVRAGAAGTSTTFRGAQFRRTASFSGANLYVADFTRAKFETRALFNATRFTNAAKFDQAKFVGPASFNSAVFNGAGNFSGAIFESSADFDGAEFRFHQTSNARFNGTVFKELASFSGTEFAGHAEFQEAQFLGGATFQGAQFCVAGQGEKGDDTAPTQPATQVSEKRIDFSRTRFHPSAQGELLNFDGALFGDATAPRFANFQQATFGNPQPKRGSTGVVEFSHVKGAAGLLLRDVTLAAGTRLRFPEAAFEGDIDLTGSTLHGDVSLERAKARALLISGTSFSYLPDLQQAEFLRTPRLHQANLPDRILLPPECNKAVLQTRLAELRDIAKEGNDRRTDNGFMVQELKLEGGVANAFYGLISRYGQSWFLPVVWLTICVVVAFPVMILLAHGYADPATLVAANDPFACKTGNGSALFASVEQSLRNALFVASDNEVRQKRLIECLAGTEASDRRSAVVAALDAVQVLVTAVFLFFIGGAIRRRYQMR